MFHWIANNEKVKWSFFFQVVERVPGGGGQAGSYDGDLGPVTHGYVVSYVQVNMDIPAAVLLHSDLTNSCFIRLNYFNFRLFVLTPQARPDGQTHLWRMNSFYELHMWHFSVWVVHGECFLEW